MGGGGGGRLKVGRAAPAARLKVWQDVAALRNQGDAVVGSGSPRAGGSDQEVLEQQEQGVEAGRSKSNLKNHAGSGRNSRVHGSVRFQITPRSRETSMVGAVGGPQQQKRRGSQHWQVVSSSGAAGGAMGLRRHGTSASLSQQQLQQLVSESAVLSKSRSSRCHDNVHLQQSTATKRSANACHLGDESDNNDARGAMLQHCGSSSSLKGSEGLWGGAPLKNAGEGVAAAAGRGAPGAASGGGGDEGGNQRKPMGPASAGSKALGNTRGAAKYLAQLPPNATAANLSALGELTRMVEAH
jgi:hypothetical protein